MENYYLINEMINKYRWISIVENHNDWGLIVSRLRGQDIPLDFGPIEIEWTPETYGREICDFPNFRPNLKCLSSNAYSRVGNLLKPFGVWIILTGLNYRAFYCQTVLDAIDEEKTSDILRQNRKSFHTPCFSPALKMNALGDISVFRLPQSISKIFVSETFRQAYEAAGLTGLEFIPAPVT